MKIGIIGSGVVGQQLGSGLLRLGREVKIGTRDTAKVSEWVTAGGANASVGSFAEAAAFGDVIFLCTLWAGTKQAIDLAGPENFKGKVVVDVTNPLDFSSGAPPKLQSAPGASGAEQIQQWLPGAKIVKAFNTISAYIMVNAPREQGVPDHFIAGHEDGKSFITEISQAWGWNSVVDMGGLEQAYLLEAFAMMWIHYGFTRNNWTHAFKLLVK